MSGYKNTWIRKSRTTVGLRLNFPWWFVPNLREQWILCPAVWGRNVGQIIYYHYREFRFLLVSKECSAAAHSDTSDDTNLLPSVTAGLEMSKPAPPPHIPHDVIYTAFELFELLFNNIYYPPYHLLTAHEYQNLKICFLSCRLSPWTYFKRLYYFYLYLSPALSSITLPLKCLI